jgi:hypothetical protein
VQPGVLQEGSQGLAAAAAGMFVPCDPEGLDLAARGIGVWHSPHLLQPLCDVSGCVRPVMVGRCCLDHAAVRAVPGRGLWGIPHHLWQANGRSALYAQC